MEIPAELQKKIFDLAIVIVALAAGIDLWDLALSTPTTRTTSAFLPFFFLSCVGSMEHDIFIYVRSGDSFQYCILKSVYEKLA